MIHVPNHKQHTRMPSRAKVDKWLPLGLRHRRGAVCPCHQRCRVDDDGLTRHDSVLEQPGYYKPRRPVRRSESPPSWEVIMLNLYSCRAFWQMISNSEPRCDDCGYPEREQRWRWTMDCCYTCTRATAWSSMSGGAKLAVPLRFAPHRRLFISSSARNVSIMARKSRRVTQCAILHGIGLSSVRI